jgi:hypothetical protein
MVHMPTPLPMETSRVSSTSVLHVGLPYAFSIYGAALKDALDLENHEVASIGAFSNAGGYSAIFSGIAYDWCGIQHITTALWTLGPKRLHYTTHCFQSIVRLVRLALA